MKHAKSNQLSVLSSYSSRSKESEWDDRLWVQLICLIAIKICAFYKVIIIYCWKACEATKNNWVCTHNMFKHLSQSKASKSLKIAFTTNVDHHYEWEQQEIFVIYSSKDKGCNNRFYNFIYYILLQDLNVWLSKASALFKSLDAFFHNQVHYNRVQMHHIMGQMYCFK